MARFPQNNNRGSALVVVVFFSAALLALLSSFHLIQEHGRRIEIRDRSYDKYQRLVNRIRAYVTNPEVIRLSATRQSNRLRGNKVLTACLNGQAEDGEKCSRVDLGILTQLSDMHEINVYPAPGTLMRAPTNLDERLSGSNPQVRQLPSSLSTVMNCPQQRNRFDEDGHTLTGSSPVEDSNDPSCLLAGATPTGGRVGYSIDGDTGPLGPCFPLQVRVFFNPYCGENAATGATQPCEDQIPLAIDLKFLIEDTSPANGSVCSAYPPFSTAKPDGSGPGNLGNRPKDVDWARIQDDQIQAGAAFQLESPLPDWFRMSTDQLAGSRCNLGAVVVGIADYGRAECSCRFPYVPTTVPPLRNARGVICEVPPNICPQGTFEAGRNTNGSPICVPPSNTQSKALGTLHLSTQALPGVGVQEQICEPSRGGWISSITTECEATTQIEQPVQVYRAMCAYFYDLGRFFWGNDPFSISKDGKQFIFNDVGVCQARTGRENFLTSSKWELNPALEAVCWAALWVWMLVVFPFLLLLLSNSLTFAIGIALQTALTLAWSSFKVTFDLKCFRLSPDKVAIHCQLDPKCDSPPDP